MATRLKVFLLILAITYIDLAAPSTALSGVGEWVTNGPTDTIVNAVAISPNYALDKTIFAGTNGNGIYKSTNGGQSWSQSGLNGYYIFALVISPNYSSDRTLFAGTYGGVYKSTDGGTSWSRCNLSGVDVSSLAISPNYASDQAIFAGTYGQGVYKSDDSGTSWIQSGLTGAYVNVLAISPSYISDQTIFAGTNGGGVYKSSDGGASWSQTNNGLTDLNVASLVVTPNYVSSNTVFADGFKSTDGGQNWNQAGPAGTEVFSLAISPNYAQDSTVFAGTYSQGVYKSTDGGTSWSQMNSGLTNTTIPSLAISPSFAQDSIVFAGSWGNGVFSCPTSIDLTPPIITATSPENNTNGVAKYKTITITFSENVAAGTAYSLITLRNANNQPVEFNKAINGRTLTIDPVSDLSLGTTYTVIIPTNAVKDTANNSFAAQYTFSFTTQDVTPPTVISTNPSNNAKDVPKDKTVTVTFSENIIAGSAYESITVKDNKNNSINIAKSINGNVLTIYPSADLSYGTSYTVTIPSGAVKDLANNTLANQFTLAFTVQADTIAPTVSSTSPSNNAASVAKETTITVTFNENVQAGSAFDSIVIKDSNNNSITASKTIKDKVLTIDPANDLIPGATYTVIIPANAVKDTANNSFAAQYAFSFTVQADNTPPAAPQALKLVSSKDAIQLSWTANKETDLAGYNVYRKLKGTASFTKINTSLIAEAQYKDMTASAGTTYIYCISAVDKSGNESQKSSELEATLNTALRPGIFADVPDNTWYNKFVTELATKGIIKGYPDKTFRPNNPVSRAEFAVMICLAKNWKLEEPSNPSFKDITKNHWAYKYIETVKSRAIISGYEGNIFKADKSITRAEIAKIISKALNLAPESKQNGATLKDIGTSWAKDYINSCIKAGIISGYSDNTFKPNNTATRAEVAKIIASVVGGN
ncbi:MAG: Ig-like domain-containing protein [Actinomycetota bacterium]